MRNLPAPSIEYRPKYERTPSATALYSSVVPFCRLLDANFGISERILRKEKLELPSYIIKPNALPSVGSNLVPSGRMFTTDTNVHVPTSCCWSDFCWARTLPGSKASPNAVITDRLRM